MMHNVSARRCLLMRSASLTAAAFLLALGAGPALAQEDADTAAAQADETPLADEAQADDAQAEDSGVIVVTAQRREQSLLDVPLAITAVTPQRLETAGVTSTVELPAVVPNLQINSAFGEAQPNFTLRGIGVANEFNANQTSPVGVYVDDVYLAARTLHGIQLFDLERVEVLRGPQGTLYGRNTTGGAVNLITRKPELDGSNGYVEVGLGTYDRFETRAAAETVLVPDTVGIRLAGTYVRHDGYFENVFPGGRDAYSQNDIAGRLSLRVRPSDAFDANLTLYAGRNRGAQNGVHPFGTAPDGTNPITGYSREADGLGFYEVDHDQTGSSVIRARGGHLTLRWEPAGQIALTSLTSYDSGRYRTAADVDGSPFELIFNTYNADTEQFNQELRLNYGSRALDLVVGLYYGWDEVDTFNIFQILGLAPAAAFGIGQEYLQTRNSYAAFGQADINLDDHWELSLGLRYTRDTISYANGRAYLTDAAGVPQTNTLPAPGPFDPNAFLPTLRREGDAVTGRAAISYTTDAGHLLYASYSRGYRAGVFNGNATELPALTYVEPEELNAYEVGAKGRFLDNALTITGALFYYDYKNQQLQDVVAPFSFLRNAPASTIKGAELEVLARVSRSLSLNGSIGLLDTQYDRLTLSGIVIDGNELPFAPAVTINAGFDWNVAELFGGELMLSANANYASRQWFSPFNALNGNQRLQQGGFTRVNARLAWRSGPITAEIWARNLFEERYYTYGLDIRSLGVDYLVPGTPRTIGAGLRFDF